MRFPKRVFLSAVLGMSIMFPQLAASASASTGQSRPGLEIVVFEIADCAYCDVFRNRVAQAYKQTDFYARAPLRFVDLESQGTAGMPLRSAVSNAPTIVVLYRGREIERIEGVPDARLFFKFVSRLLEIYG